MRASILPGDDPDFGQHVDIHKFLQIGMITRVDNELNQVDISFTSNPGVSHNVPITSPYFTGRSFIGGMPEVGSYVVCGFVKNTNDIGSPIILTYIDPFYQRSIAYSYSDGKAPDGTTDISSMKDKIGYNVIRMKRRKMYPGDIGLESSQGSELVLDDNVLLSDANLNEISISSADNSIRMVSSINEFRSSGVRLISGLVSRPGAPFLETVTMPDGKPLTLITDNNNPIDVNGQPFSELRIDIQELPSGSPTDSDMLDNYDFAVDGDDRTPLITYVMGTLIGNSRSNLQHYGRVLRPQIFTSADDTVAHVQDVVCVPTENTTIAGAFQLNFKSGTKFDVDKEGHVFISMAASTGRHPLGAGRSLELYAVGSFKMVLGKDANSGSSLDLDTTGAADLHIGHNDRDLVSLNLNLERSMYINVSAADRLGFALNETYAGNVVQSVRGNKDLTVSGNYTITVQGKIQENILGTKVENFVNDKKTNYGGRYDEAIVGVRNSVIGGLGSKPGTYGDKRTITTGGSALLVLSGDLDETLTLGSRNVILTKGDIKETLTLGDHTTLLTKGDLKETLVAGDRDTTITSGNHSINIVSGDGSIKITQGGYTISLVNGDIKIESKFGKIDLNSVTNKVTIFGMTSVEVKSGTEVKVVAPSVKLGPSPAQGGVVTGLPGVPSHLDYLTGAPLLGSATVSASI